MATAPSLEPLPLGAPAPPFELPVTPDRTFSSFHYPDESLVLVFYPADFSPVCGSELPIFNELRADLERLRARVVGISVDSVWSHLAFSHQLKLHFPLLSDFQPKGAVSRQYHAYIEDMGVSARALYVLDPGRRVVLGEIYPLEVNPGAGRVLEVLEQRAGRPAQGEVSP